MNVTTYKATHCLLLFFQPIVSIIFLFLFCSLIYVMGTNDLAAINSCLSLKFCVGNGLLDE